jgi:hypothetical protein
LFASTPRPVILRTHRESTGGRLAALATKRQLAFKVNTTPSVDQGMHVVAAVGGDAKRACGIYFGRKRTSLAPSGTNNQESSQSPKTHFAPAQTGLR